MPRMASVKRCRNPAGVVKVMQARKLDTIGALSYFSRADKASLSNEQWEWWARAALREGRWYMVTHDGVATLCEDRRDAEKEAKDADMAWPHSGPHRAVQLVEASTAGFTAADMATASAQGFRDGVASLSANAGEPRNAIDRAGLHLRAALHLIES